MHICAHVYMGRADGTIMADITPTPLNYIRILNLIMNRSTHEDDRTWAEQELERLGVQE